MPKMIEVRRLDPHDPLPEGRSHRVIVLRRFDEDDPRKIVTEITLTGEPGRSEVARPTHANGTPMSLDEVIAAARQVAKTEGIDQIFVLDRTAGQLEHELSSTPETIASLARSLLTPILKTARPVRTCGQNHLNSLTVMPNFRHIRLPYSTLDDCAALSHVSVKIRSPLRVVTNRL